MTMNSSGVMLSEDGDGLATDNELAVLGLDGSLESSVHGIVLEYVDLGKSASGEFGEPNLMYLVKRRKWTVYSRLMKGLPKSIAHALHLFLGWRTWESLIKGGKRETYILSLNAM